MQSYLPPGTGSGNPQSLGDASSTQFPAGSRKYSDRPPRGQATSDSIGTPAASMRLRQSGMSASGIARPRLSRADGAVVGTIALPTTELPLVRSALKMRNFPSPQRKNTWRPGTLE